MDFLQEGMWEPRITGWMAGAAVPQKSVCLTVCCRRPALRLSKWHQQRRRREKNQDGACGRRFLHGWSKTYLVRSPLGHKSQVMGGPELRGAQDMFLLTVRNKLRIFFFYMRWSRRWSRRDKIWNEEVRHDCSNHGTRRGRPNGKHNWRKLGGKIGRI